MFYGTCYIWNVNKQHHMAESINPEDHSRADLDKLAHDAGLADASKYPNKPAVADAINRVRAGEDAAAVNAELAPQAASQDDTAEESSDGQKASTQAADKPQGKQIHAVNGGHPMQFDVTGYPVYDPEQL
jgi:hypothetical protein